MKPYIHTMQMLGGDSNEFAVIVIITGVALVPTIFLLDSFPPP